MSNYDPCVSELSVVASTHSASSVLYNSGKTFNKLEAK